MSSARRAGLIAVGYLAAVLVAVIVAEAIMIAPSALPDGGANGSLLATLRDLPGMLTLGVTWTFPCALPGFLVAIGVAWWLGWQRWFYFSAAGALNAVPSLSILSIFFGGEPFDMGGMLLPCVPGGLAGGLTYWAIAMRRLPAPAAGAPA